MTDCPTLKVRLAEAELALHQLLTGAKTASVGFGASKSVTYTQANISELRRYINDLKDLVDECDGVGKKPRSPVRFTF